MAARRGPLGPGGDGVSASREKYRCNVNGCDHVCRGDKLAEHYKKASDLTMVDQLQKATSKLPGKTRQNRITHCIWQQADTTL